ncbi:MAG: RNA recognition motif-containing protein [candidate division WS6 bacterium GW2011_GWF2_39_15]|uniref:RNA recognition motif-containing protein n=1 Tax=candidate division WS6 bacterium GW2011_GWF2_39_15 TaxID=1619100 RepID=A0A0G0N0L2_9BACT|nr:MAG: RNA recognition motif-containing protein [candidate division WS6 bacterium GW2011_GWF2_39_15]
MKLYLGNLPYTVTAEDLKALFADYGEIEEAVVIMDKFSGRSKGFGFVTLASDEMARKAIEELNGKDLQGRSIVVNESRPMEERPRRSGGFDRNNRGGGFGGGRRDFGGNRDDRRSSF